MNIPKNRESLLFLDKEKNRYVVFNATRAVAGQICSTAHRTTNLHERLYDGRASDLRAERTLRAGAAPELFLSLLLTVAEVTLAGDRGLSDCELARESLHSSPSRAC
jgi:hypothetical protein